MNNDSISTRRAFLKGGAIIAAPLAAVAAPAAALAADDRHTRSKLAALEDEKAIRALHQDWMRRLNSGQREAAAQLYATNQCSCALAGIASIEPDRTGNADLIDIAADGNRASATYAAMVEVETLIAPDTTLAQMLHAQGEGYVRETEPRTLKADYVRDRNGKWAIAKLDFARA